MWELLILVFVAFIFGFLILLIVDRRLSQIRINVPKPEVTIHLPSQPELIKESFISKPEAEPIIKLESWSGNIQEPSPPAIFDNQTYGPMNYDFPSNLTPEKRRLFLFGYPSDMTLQDYVNWLWLYRGHEGNLDLVHLQNLERLKIGKPIIQQIPPTSRKAPPLNAQDYYERQYPVAYPPNQPTGVHWTYNSRDYVDNHNNWNVSTMQGDVYNPELGLKMDANRLMKYMTPQIQTPPPPANAPSPVDPNVSPSDQGGY